MEADFETKKKMLFECLESAEKNLLGTTLAQSKTDYNWPPYRQQRKRNRDETIDKYKHKDSLFKRPDLPINKCLKSRQKPEYEKNPNKWQHYSLDDVSDTSDRMNTSAAFSFLKDLENRRSLDSPMNSNEPEGGKIIFKKSIRLKPRDDEIDPQVNQKKVQGNKIVMPEYVIGEKKQRPRKERRPKDNSAPSTGLKLSHLDEDEEET